MLNKLYLAFFGLTAACASAQQPQSARPAPVVNIAPANTCAKDDRILFGMSTRPNGQYGGGVDGGSLVVYETGAWVSSRMGATARGCLDAGVVAKIRRELAGAKWEVAYDTITCDAVPTHFTDYTVSGKRVFTQAMCSGERLDAESAKILDEVTRQVAAATK